MAAVRDIRASFPLPITEISTTNSFSFQVIRRQGAGSNSSANQSSNRCSKRHGQSPPEGYSQSRLKDVCAASLGSDCAEEREKTEGRN
jgi:hypothetical protein